MSDSYNKVKGGRLTFKGGSLATTSKTIEKNKNKNKKKKKNKTAGVIIDETLISSSPAAGEGTESVETGGEVYTIDAAKRMKYEELFPVETKKFGYHGKANFKSLEDALDDRVKKKADRYCK